MSISIAIEDNFQAWRAAARGLLAERAAPHDVCWTTGEQTSLFEPRRIEHVGPANINLPRAFFEAAEAAACFDSSEKWSLLYRLAFRLAFENKVLLEIESDADVRRLRLMEKAVSRDVHKFHAFVRFRRIECADREIFIAWHEPQHFTVERAAPFFARRFGSMMFSILTPKGSAHWDRSALTFGPPASREITPEGDETEDFWLLYYRSIFNPFRLKVRAMKKELPVRHWPTLPEAALIGELIREAGERQAKSATLKEQ